MRSQKIAQAEISKINFVKVPKLMSAPPSQEHNAHPTYRPDIDGLRAVAILSVVIFHAFPIVLRGGFVGVDIFFVISGFLISSIIFGSLQRNDFSFVEFYAHRIKRIFPALIIVLVASYTFGWFALLPDEFKQLGKHIAASAGFVQNFVLWKEAGYFDEASELKPLMHLWSLAIEEQFYLIYPLLIWGAWRLRFNVLTVIGVLGIISFGLNITGVQKDVVETFFAPQTRFWELLTGALLAYFQFFKRVHFTEWLQTVTTQQDERLNTLLSIAGGLLILVAIFGFCKAMLFPGWWALLPVIGAFLLILAGADAWVNRKILANRLLVFIGIISYPLYLWHWSLLSFVRIIEEETPSRRMRVIALALSFLFAWLTYHLVEKPLRFGPKTVSKIVTLCTLMIVITFIGYITFQHNGFPSRLSPSIGSQNEQFQNKSTKSCQSGYPNFASFRCPGTKISKPTILLLGDSHSMSLHAGLLEAINDSTDNVLTFAGWGCLPFFNVASFQKTAQDSCAEMANYSLKFAEKQDSIRTVILSARGPMYLSGKGYGSIEVDTNRFLAFPDKPEITDFHVVFRLAMRETIARLLAKRKQVIFVLDVPELGFSPKRCVQTRPLYLSHPIPIKPCAITRQDFEARNREYRELVFAVLKEFPSVQVFDAAAQLCDDQWCWAMKDGKMLYRDDDHLSIEGSRLVAHALVKLIQTKPPLAQ
ncbi:MAG: acyltransferase family protein [Gallionella sp.]|nr:acyltransferase family protein [Gallionella sp.]